MNGIIKERIGERIGALKVSWRQASIEAGLGSGFIQDIITGRTSEPTEQALTSLASVLKCSPAYLTGQTDEVAGNTIVRPERPRAVEPTERPDAIMALRIVDELLAGGHVDAARLAVRRALKTIATQQDG